MVTYLYPCKRVLQLLFQGNVQGGLERLGISSLISIAPLFYQEIYILSRKPISFKIKYLEVY